MPDQWTIALPIFRPTVLIQNTLIFSWSIEKNFFLLNLLKQWKFGVLNLKYFFSDSVWIAVVSLCPNFGNTNPEPLSRVTSLSGVCSPDNTKPVYWLVQVVSAVWIRPYYTSTPVLCLSVLPLGLVSGGEVG